MELDTSNQQTTSPVQNTPPVPVANSSISNEKGLVPIIIGIVFLLIVVAGAAYYLGTRQQSIVPSTNQTSNSNTAQVTISTPQPSEIPSEPPTKDTSLENWSYKSSGECGVQFLLPPANPGIDGMFWDFPRGVVYPNLISKLPNGHELYKEATTMYVSKENWGGGYIDSAVAVSCIPNNSNVDNQGMMSLLTSGIQNYNQQNNTEGMGATQYTIQSSKQVSRWNHQVMDLTVAEYFQNSGGEPITKTEQYTMFATPKFIYEVRVMGATTDTTTKDTAQKIFDNLKFAN